MKLWILIIAGAVLEFGMLTAILVGVYRPREVVVPAPITQPVDSIGGKIKELDGMCSGLEMIKKNGEWGVKAYALEKNGESYRSATVASRSLEECISRTLSIMAPRPEAPRGVNK